ncbi:MAG: glycosyltransferase family 2 protein, partial [Geminicoccaceae bacterium]|nr:glycosyltransferase family 2 protein [Geminicoccaceae bacterium]
MIPFPPFFDLLAQTTAVLVIVVSMAQNLLYLVLLLTAVSVMLGRPRVHQSRALWNGLVDGAPPVSVIVPAYNEAETIADSLRSLLALEYPDFRVVVVNDGSTDATLDVLMREFGLEPAPLEHVSTLPHAPARGLYRSTRHANLVVLDKVNSGKADALNAGLGQVTTELFCAVDADSLIEADG